MYTTCNRVYEKQTLSILCSDSGLILKIPLCICNVSKIYLSSKHPGMFHIRDTRLVRSALDWIMKMSCLSLSLSLPN